MRYHTPTSFADAATIAAGTTGTLRFLAGGTDVLVQMRAGMVQPDDLIDLKHIPGVDQVTQTPEGGWRSGVAGTGSGVGEQGGGMRAGAGKGFSGPFHAKRVGGVGLGLAIARRIVELDGGTIEARNHQTGGAELTISLPEHS